MTKKQEIKYRTKYIVRENQVRPRLPGKYSICIGTFDDKQVAQDCLDEAQKISGMPDSEYMIIDHQVAYGEKEVTKAKIDNGLILSEDDF